jgi:hypothetical protein
MIPIKFLEDYLIDQDDRLKKLMTWFSNMVMQRKAIRQSDAEPYHRVDSRKAHRLENLNFAKSLLRLRFLTDIRG